MKKVLLYASTMILVLAVSSALFIIVSPYFGWRIDAVAGNSMNPTIKIGDAVITQPAGASEITVGDIITYVSPLDSKLVTHRVVEIRDNNRLMIQTKGDANDSIDNYGVPPENLIGRVVFDLPYIGYIKNILENRTLLLIAVIIPAILLVTMEIRTLYHLIAKRRDAY